MFTWLLGTVQTGIINIKDFYGFGSSEEETKEAIESPTISERLSTAGSLVTGFLSPIGTNIEGTIEVVGGGLGSFLSGLIKPLIPLMIIGIIGFIIYKSLPGIIAKAVTK